MDSAMEQFVAEGMMRYKRASAVLVSFGKVMKRRLQQILSQRASVGWGRFAPGKGKSIKSTTYWSEYPLFNAKIDGLLGETPLRLSLEVNWFMAAGDYPYYAVSLEPAAPYCEQLQAFRWKPGVSPLGGNSGIGLDPDPSDFDLERDFGTLLDEMVRFLGTC